MSDDKNIEVKRTSPRQQAKAPSADIPVDVSDGASEVIQELLPDKEGHFASANVVSCLRWVIPLLIALIAIGYIFFEQVLFEGHFASSAHVIRSILVIGSVGPCLAWLLLTWAAKLVRDEAKTHNELTAQTRRIAALSSIGNAVSRSLDLEDILQAALERTVELTGVQAGEMRMVEDGMLVLKAHHGISQALREEKSVSLGHCLCGRCAQVEKALVENDLSTVSFLANVPCAQAGFQSAISMPIKTKEELLGVMFLAKSSPNTFTFGEEQFLTAVASRVAAAIENARLYERAQRRAIHLETASLVGQRLASLLELNSLLAEVTKLISDRFGYHRVNIFLVDEASGEIVLKEASGAYANSIKAHEPRLKIGREGITGWVAHTGQTLVCNNVSREPRYYALELAPETKAELAVPLRVGNRIVGVLDVLSDRRDAFDKEDVTILQILGNQIGVAIRNAQLFQETKHRYNAMLALHETSLDIIAQLDPSQLFTALLRRGAQLLDAEAGSLFLYDAQQGLIRNVANFNTWRDWTDVTMKLGEGMIGRVIQTHEPLIVNDYESWSGRSDTFGDSPQTRIVSVPLNWDHQIIGGINISNSAHSRPFDENDLWLLTLFADMATIAVKNANLHTQTKEFSQELEHRVEERTEELSRAKDQIEATAEQLRLLLATTIDIQEKERARIARDMHDGIIQLISAVRYEIQAIGVVVGPESAVRVNEKLDSVFHVLEEMEKEIRRAIYDLHPPILDIVGLVPALQKYAQSLHSVSKFACEVHVKGVPYQLPPETDLALFRAIQEALQNVVVHAKIAAASVVVDYEPNLLSVSVQDNGVGFDFQQANEPRYKNHLGLLSMHERIENVGGKMEMWSEVGRGTRVLFQLPIAQD